jgi:hypothetical protein
MSRSVDSATGIEVPAWCGVLLFEVKTTEARDSAVRARAEGLAISSPFCHPVSAWGVCLQCLGRTVRKSRFDLSVDVSSSHGTSQPEQVVLSMANRLFLSSGSARPAATAKYRPMIGFCAFL